MKSLGLGAALLLVMGLLSLSVMASGPAQHGPYYVVDPDIAPADVTSHVFKTIQGAVAAMNAVGQEAWGATLTLLPGTHVLAAPGPLVIAIPGLTIQAKEPEDVEKTQVLINGFTGGAAGIQIQARDVTLSNIKIVGEAPGGAADVHAVGVEASGCLLHGLVIESFTGSGVTFTGAHYLTIESCDILNCAVRGIDGLNSLFVTIQDTQLSANGASALRLQGCDAALLSASEAMLNADGFVITGCREPHLEGLRCDSNGVSGITLDLSQDATIENSEVDSTSAGPGILVRGCANSYVTGCALSDNFGGGILVTEGPAALGVPSVGVEISANTILAQAGAPGAPAVPGVSLSGNVMSCKVSENEVTRNAYGIALLQIAGPPITSPSQNQVTGNAINASTINGIFIGNSSGGNTFEGNTVDGTNQSGIVVASGGFDTFIGNKVLQAGTDGFLVQPGVSGTVIRDCSIVGAGAFGISLTATGGARLESNNIQECSAGGLRDSGGSANLVAVGNAIHHNDGNGITLEALGAVTLQQNAVYLNRLTGISLLNCPWVSITKWNRVSGNSRGGVTIDPASAGVISGALFYDNLGSGVSSASPNLSLGQNWWGSSSGPAGVFGGTGNAFTNNTGSVTIASPILPAPPMTRRDEELVALADYVKSQVSFITTFASQKVTVNNLDTAGVRLAFTDVEDRAAGWVSTAPVSPAGLAASVDEALPGEVVKAAAVLVGGVSNGGGLVQIGMEAGGATNPSELELYTYVDGTWTIDESGAAHLSGGAWEPVQGCTYDGLALVVGEVDLNLLTGRVKLLVLTGAEGVEAALEEEGEPTEEDPETP